jgi:hypothetical protein
MRVVAGLAIAVVAVLVPLQSAMADDLTVKISAPAEVIAGDQITLAVRTEPGASCEGNVAWKSEKGQQHNNVRLVQRTANSDGKVMWSWKIGQGPAAQGPIVVTCQAGDKSGTASASVTRR